MIKANERKKDSQSLSPSDRKIDRQKDSQTTFFKYLDVDFYYLTGSRRITQFPEGIKRMYGIPSYASSRGYI